jgi:sec-independent protein translocase protein TatC
MILLFFFIVFALLGAGYWYSIKILIFMVQYLRQAFDVAVISLAPHDIILTILKIDLLMVSLIMLPVFIIMAVYYIAPALYENEKKFIVYIPLMFILAALGLSFGWILSIKIFIPYLQSFSTLVGIPNNWSIVNLISFILTMCMVFMLIFQLPIIITMLVNLNILDLKKIKNIRKVAVLISVILGAVVTPPDVASQLLVALPFFLLFEMTIQYIKLKQRFMKNLKK